MEILLKNLSSRSTKPARAVLTLALAIFSLFIANCAHAQTQTPAVTPTSSEVKSPTRTSTEVKSPTKTSTQAHTSDNVTVTGGAGAGNTTVNILPKKGR